MSQLRVVDFTGAEIKLAQPAKRIVCLTAAGLDILLELAIVGIDVAYVFAIATSALMLEILCDTSNESDLNFFIVRLLLQ